MVKMNINDELEYILLKSRIITDTSYYKAIQTLHDLEEAFISGSIIALYGVGIEAEGLLHFISEHTTDFRITVCFDQVIRSYKYKNLVQNSTVSPIENVVKMDVDYVILGSYIYRDTFRKNLSELGYSGQIIDLYSCLNGYIKNYFADYKMVYETRQSYLKSRSLNKIHLMQRLIKEYIAIKDFKNAFYYIDEYIKKRYSGFKRYKVLKSEICNLLEKVKKCISGRKGKDIIINWIDALSFYDISAFAFLKERENESVTFKNAYTVMPWTTETLKTILFGEYPIEGKLFLRECFSAENVNLIKALSEYGYGFGYCGMPRYAKLFDESVQAPISYYDNKHSGSISKYWEALNILCQSERPMCILIHTLRETHEPFICGEGETFIHFGSTEADWNQEMCRKQAEISGKYIDSQFAFYDRFYGEETIKIYMSDHGRIGNSPMNENKIHTILFVCGKKIKPRCIEGMFSLVKFPELIKEILLYRENWGHLTDDYVLIENLDAYSEPAVNDTLSGRLKKEEMYQCRGIVTKSDRYFLYAYGKEYYFKDWELGKNEIDNPMFQKRIMDLRKICGDTFIDICQYDKFKYSRLLYKKG